MSKTVTFTIDGQSVNAAPGSLLIDAAEAVGIHIPRFCYHHALSIAANCRMCLVELEMPKARHPQPACATRVTEGMIVHTRSKVAREAQEGTLEFLLINHPLDCPVCDQGGECPLQDQAQGYGQDASRFAETKRAVPSPDIGPLIATYMTRCIHCTRCVRFGQELGGVMELGMPGRGEHAHIASFLDHSVDSELSGNMIDLCPVGALTAKPYRFTARVWELQNQPAISPHDCLGSNMNLQTLRGQVKRVAPRDNPAINDCWLADRDRFGYEGLNSDARLLEPRQRQADGSWKAIDWAAALAAASAGIRAATADDPGQFAALAHPSATLEEFHLLQQLTRALGSDAVDCRLQQQDFSPVAGRVVAHSECPITDYANLDAALLVGSNIRKEQPLLGLWLRVAAHDGAQISYLNSVAYAQNFPLLEEIICKPQDWLRTLVGLAMAVSEQTKAALPKSLAALTRKTGSHETAELLMAAKRGLIVLGADARRHLQYGQVLTVCEWIAQQTGCALAVLPAGNELAGQLSGCRPQTSDWHCARMLAEPRKAYLLLGAEPLDCADSGQAHRAFEQAFTVALTAFASAELLACADLLLPLAAFAETDGSYINLMQTEQFSKAAVPPPGEARPGWKILRVLGNFLELPGFDYLSVEAVREAAQINAAPSLRQADWQWPESARASKAKLVRLAPMPMYRGEALLRHADALQRTADNPPPAARIHPKTLSKLNGGAWTRVSVRAEGETVELPLAADEAIAPDCVWLPAGFVETAPLGGEGAPIEIVGGRSDA